MINPSNSPNGVGTAGADIFLSVKSKRAGPIKGESQANEHKDAIVVHMWSWGATSNSALGTPTATGRRSYKQLVVSKSIDSATTGLLSVLATNDEVKEAKLAMRKAGEGQRDFFTITLTDARVKSVDFECDPSGQTVERVTFSFTKVQVDYEVQQTSGQRGAGFSFQDEVLAV